MARLTIRWAAVLLATFWATRAAAASKLVAVDRMPGAFQRESGAAPLAAHGRALGAAEVESLAGKPEGYDVLAGGLSNFGMDYAQQAGRREPLRAMAADLADWQQAPACPPDHVLVDPRNGRLRFFAGHDPASFRSRVLARHRGTHGDNAIPIWRGNTLFLSHWESSYHVWAYDVSDTRAPRQVGELEVANFAHGFVLLDSGYALMGTTAPQGPFLLDLRDPAHMRVVRSSLAARRKPSEEMDWFGTITGRYVALWDSKAGQQTPRIFDTAGLPERFPELTAEVPAAVLPYLSGRIDGLRSADHGWFRSGNRIALVELSGGPAKWKIARQIELEGQCKEIKPLDEGRFVVWSAEPHRLQVLDVRSGKVRWGRAVDVPATTRALNVLGRHAYLAQVPSKVNEAAVGTWDEAHFDIYDLTAYSPSLVGHWAPAVPNRAMWLYPHPDRAGLVLVLEPGVGSGFYLGDFADPVHPRVLSEVVTNGEGNRVAAAGDRAIYTSSTLAQWYALGPDGTPRLLGKWFNHRWFRALDVLDSTAVINDEVVDFADPRAPRPVAKIRERTSFGTLGYNVTGGLSQGPVRVEITDLSDPRRPHDLGHAEFPEKSYPPIAGAWADGRWLYVITEGDKDTPANRQTGKRIATLLVFDVADAANIQLVSSFQHAELEVQRGDWFWTAQGRAITAARGIVVITSYCSGGPKLIDVRKPEAPKFLGPLPTPFGNRWVPRGEFVDSYPDGPWYYVKAYSDPVMLWDFSDPAHPRKLWQETVEGDYDRYGWQAGVPKGEVLLSPRLPYLKVLTVPRPSQVPPGPLVMR